MSKLPVDPKLNAYEEAIGHLRAADSEDPDEMRAFHWLADKLDRECQKWFNSLKKIE